MHALFFLPEISLHEISPTVIFSQGPNGIKIKMFPAAFFFYYKQIWNIKN